jgi:hypothetical protein
VDRKRFPAGRIFQPGNCKDFKKRVLQLNTPFQQTIISIGGHTLMHGIGLDTEFSDTIKVEKLWKDMKTEYGGNMAKVVSKYLSIHQI